MAASGDPLFGRPDNPARAAAFMMIAALLLPLLNAAIKILAPRYPVGELLWWRYAGHLAFMLVVFAPRRGRALLASRKPGLQTVRSLLFCGSTLLTFTALAFVPLATAAAISFTAPLIVTALAPLLLAERVGLSRALAVAAGFVGALVVVRPGSGALHPTAFLLFGGAICSALTQILSRKLAAFDPPETSNTYMVAAGFAVSSLILPFHWVTPHTGADLALMASLGLLGGLGHYCLVRAFELAPAPFVSPFIYAQILGAALLSAVIFAEPPDLWTWLGSAIIALSGLIILLLERLRSRKARPTVSGEA